MILIKNIKGLLQVREGETPRLTGAALGKLPVLENAWLLITGAYIAAYGTMETCPEQHAAELQVFDATGRFVFPAFVDSHTHLVFAGSREGEFADRINGLSYEEMSRKGGGILNSAKLLQNTSEDELYETALVRAEEIIATGTGAVEIKSGYGLTTPDEIKLLRVAKRLQKNTDLTVRTTFLGAHAVPAGTDRQHYVKLLTDTMIPAVAAEGLADYCDVFCDRGFFTPEEADRILHAGLAHGLKPRVHANELANSGGVQVAVRNGAISADHLEFLGDDEIAALKSGHTIPTLLPGTAFFLKLHYPDARRLIAAGLPVSLASDYNPGTCPGGNMPFVLSLACTQLRMSPEEAINAATINAAHALELQSSHGSITVGKKASVFITQPMPSYTYLPYSFASRLVDTVILNGKVQGSAGE